MATADKLVNRRCQLVYSMKVVFVGFTAEQCQAWAYNPDRRHNSPRLLVDKHQSDNILEFEWPRRIAAKNNDAGRSR